MELSTSQIGASRHIRLGPLYFPSDLTPLPDVAMELAQASQSASIILKSADDGVHGKKSGFILATFASTETADLCLKNIEAKIASLDRQWKLEQFSVNDVTDDVVDGMPTDYPVCNGKQPQDGYVLVGGLLPSVDEQTLADIFGASDVVGVKFSHEPGQLLKTAIVQFKTKESAEAAIESFEGYEVDDGATKTHISMQLVQSNVATGESVSPSTLESGPDGEGHVEKPSNGHVDSVCEGLEQTPDQICLCIRELMIAERTNWAELAGEKDLWLILDKVTHMIGWQPEETLKEAMMTTLQTALAECEYDWLAEHLRMLQRKWSKEVDNPDKSKIHRHLLLASADGRSIPGHNHVPPAAKKTRKPNKQSIALMSIGGVLSKMKSQNEEAANSKCNFANEKGKKKITEQRPSAKKRRRDQSSSESGEASSTSPSSSEEEEEREEGEYRKNKTRRHRMNSDGTKSKGTTNRRSKQIDPEWTQSILEQVIPYMFRMMPKLIEWMNVNKNSSLDSPFRQETVTMSQSFSNSGMMPLPMNNYGYRAPTAPVGPPYAPPMVANLNVPPPINVSQPLYGVSSSPYSFSGTTMRIPFAPAPPPPPPPNRQY